MSEKFIPNVSRFKIPSYKYIAPKAWAPFNAQKEIARLRLLHACERLQIAVELGQIELNMAPDHGGWFLKGFEMTLPDSEAGRS